MSRNRRSRRFWWHRHSASFNTIASLPMSTLLHDARLLYIASGDLSSQLHLAALAFSAAIPSGAFVAGAEDYSLISLLTAQGRRRAVIASGNFAEYVFHCLSRLLTTFRLRFTALTLALRTRMILAPITACADVDARHIIMLTYTNFNIGLITGFPRSILSIS